MICDENYQSAGNMYFIAQVIKNHQSLKDDCLVSLNLKIQTKTFKPFLYDFYKPDLYDALGMTVQ